MKTFEMIFYKDKKGKPMNYIRLILLIIIIAGNDLMAMNSLSQDGGEYSDTLHFATFNIRIETDDDEGNRNWDARKQYVADVIDTYSFDVSGIQEMASSSQQSDLMGYLDDYSIFSKGRYSNGNSGERVGILYKTDRFDVVDQDYFYLSETPDVQSVGWDGSLVRMCLWTKFYDKATEQSFYFFATHFDHKGDTVRCASAKLIISKINEMTTDDTLPVFLVGDFNLSKVDEVRAYNILGYGILSDSKNLVSHRNISGPTGTSNHWDMSDSYDTESNRIDFIFVDSLVDPISYSVIDDQYVDDAYPSDHFPIMITCSFGDNSNENVAIENIENKDQCKVYTKSDNIIITCDKAFSYAIYNLQGGFIEKGVSANNQKTIGWNTDRSTGVYLVQVMTDNSKKTYKIIK